MLIDSHHHLWNYDKDEYAWISDEMSRLKQDFGSTELRRVATDSNVQGFVSVQARQTIEETNDLLSVAAEEPLIHGVVGWAPLCSKEVGTVLDRYKDTPLLKGVRHVVQDEPDDEFLLRDDFNRGISELLGRNLIYDVLIYARQLPAAVKFVDRHPDQPMILDHIAKPTVSRDNFDQFWKDHFFELSRREQVMCKFSGVVTEIRDTDWDIESIRPYWDIAIEAFTPKRLMFGSDWPVCLLRTEYQQWIDIVRELASELSESEQIDFFANNAIRSYNLAN